MVSVVHSIAVMLAVVTLASTRDSSSSETGFFDRLKSDMAKALNRITTLNKEKIVLLNGVHLEKYFNSCKSDDVDAFSRSAEDLNQLIEKTIHIFDTRFLLLELVPGFHIKIYKTPANKFALSLIRGPEKHNVLRDARTFGIGARKRLQMALLPIMYKLGVITTLLVGLTVLTLKALTIGVILLILAFGGIFTKLKAAPWDESYGGHHKDVHIHVHPFLGGKHHGSWKTWQRQEELAEESKLGYKNEEPSLHQSSHHHHHPHPHHHTGAGTAGSVVSHPYSFFPPSVSGLID